MGLKIAVLGAGRLGYANALYLSARCDSLLLYDRNDSLVKQINAGNHPVHFSEFEVPGNIAATSNLDDIADAPIIFNDLHSAGIEPVFSQIQSLLPGVIIVNDAKGMRGQKLPLEIISGQLGDHPFYGVTRGGWMLAGDLVSGKPVYTQVACKDPDVAHIVATLTGLNSINVKVRTSTDPVGVQLAGILKNVYAIGAGAFDGLIKAEQLAHDFPSEPSEFESNLYIHKVIFTHAATYEAKQLALSKGAHAQTFRGDNFAWGKDFYSCSWGDSINRGLGAGIGFGMSPLEALEWVKRETNRVPEGYHSAGELKEFFSDSPDKHIMDGICRGLYEGVPFNVVLRDTIREIGPKYNGSKAVRNIHAAEKLIVRTLGF